MVWGFKVNDQLIERGVAVISELKRYGNVFADPKLHDIPNTVRNGVKRLVSAGADLITIHASGGTKMIQEAVSVSAQAEILSVLSMTSLVDEDTRAIYGAPVRETWDRLARLAIAAGTHGLICSGPELPMLREIGAPPMTVITPGIRPSWYGTADDQQRINTPVQALANGATHLVIGRPITKDPNPRQAAERIAEELRTGAR
jgi:orotidine-5'-phosphate decarboxylase